MTESFVELVIAPGFLHLPLVRAILADYIEVAAQDVSQFGNGEFTGEISAKLLKEHKTKWVLIGHSERREKFGDKDEVVFKNSFHRLWRKKWNRRWHKDLMRSFALARNSKKKTKARRMK